MFCHSRQGYSQKYCMRLFLAQTFSMKIFKPGYPALLFVCLLVISGCLEHPKPGKLRYDTDTISAPPRGGRCYGLTPCTARSDCSLCKFCNNGGTCGKCENRVRAEDPGARTLSNGTTCRGITKKGKRCKRSPRQSGYCYQHEGK